jgi:hypothetical protein
LRGRNPGDRRLHRKLWCFSCRGHYHRGVQFTCQL